MVCCKEFERHYYKIGKFFDFIKKDERGFYITHHCSGDSSTRVDINYCPFCGQKLVHDSKYSTGDWVSGFFMGDGI